MENAFAFESYIQVVSAFANPEVKLLTPEDLETAIGFGCDEFQIEDLLEFSNEVTGGQINATHPSHQSAESALTAADSSCQHSSSNPTEHLHKAMDSEEEAKALCLDDEFTELDWLSNFVEDPCCRSDHLKVDYSQDSLINLDMMMMMMQNYPEICDTSDQFQMTSPVSVLESSGASGSADSVSCWENHSPLPGRARSKRSRLGSKTWTSPVMSAAATASSQDPTESNSHAGALLSFYCSELTKKPPKPWQGRKVPHDGSEVRKCAHCLSERTPQWRAGPGGPKTLCNACGVRFKSGRLFPEYRPALSPTFESHIHSNSHRKVLDMRRQKEMGLMQQKAMNLSELQP